MRKFLRPVFLVCLAGTISACARDVVIKPAVIAFNGNARTAVDSARQQYRRTITRLNDQTADFIAEHPDCGLAVMIVRRQDNPPPRGIAPPNPPTYCLSDAEKDALPGDIKNARLFIAGDSTFAAQFTALDLLVDYVTFLAKYADDPKLTAKTDITATATATQGLGTGVSDLIKAFGGKGLKEFDKDGAVAKFSGAIGNLAEQFEIIAKQADDVAALERAIKQGEAPVNAAIDELVVSADLWTCAELERTQISSNDFALTWTPKLPGLAADKRKDVASRWIAMQQNKPPAYCSSASGLTVAAVDHSSVGEMLLAVKKANLELVHIANHKYTPAQRKAIIEATMSRLGQTLSRIASLATLLA